MFRFVFQANLSEMLGVGEQVGDCFDSLFVFVILHGLDLVNACLGFIDVGHCSLLGVLDFGSFVGAEGADDCIRGAEGLEPTRGGHNP